MKRILLLMTILAVSVVSTACISNFAIKELNNKAQDYLNSGDVDSAICRLKSSLDLDSELYETHYNLGVAYLAADNQEDAISAFTRVIELKPDYNDAYYSLGVANASVAYKLSEKEQTEGLSAEENQKLDYALNEAVDKFNRYIANVPKADNAEDIKNQIEQLSGILKERAEKSGAGVQNDDEDFSDIEETEEE
ncbi:tetratricopeptide repeat protein [bacterium]|nr:tetratricopeptide repeat protein [bacterium]